MTPLPSRDELEAELMKALGKVDQATRKRVLTALGDPPNLDALTADIWREIGVDYHAAIAPTLETTFLTAAQTLSENVGIGMDWTLMNERAMTWAETYVSDLTRTMTANNQRFMQQAISQFYAKPTPNADLTAQLETQIGRYYGGQRAESIAITEVTRASVQGDLALADELNGLGLRLVAVWDTVSDGHVCALCDPNDGKKHGDGWYTYPPLHVRCRCGVHWEVVENKTLKAFAVGQTVSGWSSRRGS